jgi:hypothetical protein
MSATARRGFAITPNDSLVLPKWPKQIWVGGAGDVAVILSGDDPTNAGVDVTILKNVPAGTMLDINPKRVMLSGTTATLLVGLIY